MMMVMMMVRWLLWLRLLRLLQKRRLTLAKGLYERYGGRRWLLHQVDLLYHFADLVAQDPEEAELGKGYNAESNDEQEVRGSAHPVFDVQLAALGVGFLARHYFRVTTAVALAVAAATTATTLGTACNVGTGGAGASAADGTSISDIELSHDGLEAATLRPPGAIVSRFRNTATGKLLLQLVPLLGKSSIFPVILLKNI